MEEGGTGECAPSRISRGKAESGREWERAGRRLEGMGVVPERWDDEAAEALALAGEAPSPSARPRCCMCECVCECKWDEAARCPADGSCRMSPRNPSRLGPCASAGAFWAGGGASLSVVYSRCYRKRAPWVG